LPAKRRYNSPEKLNEKNLRIPPFAINLKHLHVINNIACKTI